MIDQYDSYQARMWKGCSPMQDLNEGSSLFTSFVICIMSKLPDNNEQCCQYRNIWSAHKAPFRFETAQPNAYSLISVYHLPWTWLMQHLENLKLQHGIYRLWNQVRPCQRSAKQHTTKGVDIALQLLHYDGTVVLNCHSSCATFRHKPSTKK